MKSLEKIFQDIASRFKINEWMIEGVHVWPIIQIQLGSKYPGNNLDHLPKSRKTLFRFSAKYFNLVKNYFKSYILDYKMNDAVRPSHVVFFCEGIDRVKVVNSYYDRIAGPLVETLEKNGYRTFCFEGSKYFNIPRAGKSKLVQLRFLIELIISTIEYYLRKKYHNRRFAFFSDFRRFILDNYGINYKNKELIISWIYMERIKRYFEIKLKHIRPSVGIVVNYYNSEGFAFVLACKRLGVPVADLQHGVQGPHHYAYSFWLVPEAGYKLLPDYFLCWSESETKNILRWSRNVHKAIVVGNMFMSKWKFDKGDGVVAFYDDLIKKVKQKAQLKSHVLYTFPDQGFPQNFLLDIMKTDCFFFWIRLHPGHLDRIRDVKNYLVKNGVTSFSIEQASSFPLYAILRNIDVHITDISSVVIEAAAFGVPSIILNNSLGEIYYKRYVDEGLAYMHEGDMDLVCLIESLSYKKQSRVFEPKRNEEEVKMENVLNTLKRRINLC